jgi:hypothetical protein
MDDDESAFSEWTAKLIWSVRTAANIFLNSPVPIKYVEHSVESEGGLRTF